MAINCNVYLDGKDFVQLGEGKKRFSLKSFGEYTILSLFLMKVMKFKRKAMKGDPYSQIEKLREFNS